MAVSAPVPTAHGLSFASRHGHALRLCDDDITLPWKDVVPYLTEAGKAGMADATAPP